MIKISNDNWMTPDNLYSKLKNEFHFVLDAACTIENSKCYFGLFIDDNWDALTVNWKEEIDWFYGEHTKNRTNYNVWLNPPYSKPNLELFTQKAYEESQKGCTVVGLIPLVCSPKWYDKYVMNKAHEIRFCTKRVRFIDPETGKKAGSPAFDSMIVVWKPGIPKETKFSMFEW